MWLLWSPICDIIVIGGVSANSKVPWQQAAWHSFSQGEVISWFKIFPVVTAHDDQEAVHSIINRDAQLHIGSRYSAYTGFFSPQSDYTQITEWNEKHIFCVDYLSTQINPWIHLQEIIENSAKYFSAISLGKFIEKNISFESITALVCVVFEDLKFSPILGQKYTRHRCVSQKAPILDFQVILELFNVKCRSHH